MSGYNEIHKQLQNVNLRMNSCSQQIDLPDAQQNKKVLDTFQKVTGITA